MKKYFSIILICLTTCLLFGCSGRTEAYNKTDFCFDTSVSITIYDTVKNADHAKELLNDCIAMCHTYDDMFSRTKENSDVYRINHADGEWTAVSDETISLIQSSLEYCNMTSGDIDITIAPVKDMWNFTQTDEIHMPASSDLERMLTHVDYTQIEIKGNKVRLSDPEASIDLGFIAKGYIADHIRAFLLENGVKSALINLGGNIATIGEKPDGTTFQIGVQKPFAASGSYITVVSCSDRDSDYSSIVTSGVYERYFEYNDKLYHHILDTSTGQPATTDLLSATILTDSSIHADALSTICILLGLEKSLNYINSLGEVDAIFITSDGELIDTRETVN